MRILDTTGEARERLYLKHETVYRYSEPVVFLPHRLVLRPRENHEVQLHSMDLETFPSARITWYRDILDNSIAYAEFSEPSDTLRICSRFVVYLPPPEERSPDPIPVPYPSRVAGIDELIAVPYRQFTYPPEVEQLRRWFIGTGIGKKKLDGYPIFDDLASLIRSMIGYRRREESGVQTPLETLKHGSGSCRDMAVLMIETSRALGYPARFVSGYLDGSNSRVGRGSTHAWTEIYLPEHGWAGYDPSIGKRIGPGHIAIGVSHHPRGVMPVTGGYSGAAGVTASLEVKITTRRGRGEDAFSTDPCITPSTGE